MDNGSVLKQIKIKIKTPTSKCRVTKDFRQDWKKHLTSSLLNIPVHLKPYLHSPPPLKCPARCHTPTHLSLNYTLKELKTQEGCNSLTHEGRPTLLLGNLCPQDTTKGMFPTGLHYQRK